jgi:hypothetical protein
MAAQLSGSFRCTTFSDEFILIEATMTGPIYTRNQINAESIAYEADATERARLRRIIAVVGDGAGNVESARVGYVFVRLFNGEGKMTEARNQSAFLLENNMLVDLLEVRKYARTHYVVAGPSYDFWYDIDSEEDDIGNSLRAHAPQHERWDRGQGGSDPVDVFTRMLVPVRAQAQTTPDMTLYVAPGFYDLNGYKYWEGGSSPAFTLPTMTEGSRWDLLYLGDDDALHILKGVPGSYSSTPAFPTDVPAASLPLAFVYITSSTTSLNEAVIADARILFGAARPNNLAATQVGEVVYSVDGASAKPEVPLIGDDGYWITGDDGQLLVV